MEENKGPRLPYQAKEYYQKYVKGETHDIDYAPISADDYMKKAMWVYSLYCSGTLYTKPGGQCGGRSMKELRDYGNGDQPFTKYQQWIDRTVKSGADPELSKRFNFDNISWDNNRVFSKFRNLATSKIKSPKFDPTVVATDTYSNAQRNIAIAMDKLNMMPQMQALDQITGIPGQVSGIAKAVDGDVDTAVAIGSYMLPMEAEFQDAISVSMRASTWDTVKSMLATDIIDYGFCGVDTEFEEEEGIVKIKYIDPVGLIIPASDYPDCRDMQFAAYLEHVRISQLRKEIIEGDDENEKEKNLYKIAKFYGAYAPNTRMHAQNRNFNDLEFRREYNVRHGRQVYDPYTVLVLNLKFISHEYIDGACIPQTYKCKWVVGTDTVYDCERDGATARQGSNGNKKAILPIIAYTIPGPSVTERAIAHIDGLQMATLKLRALIANLPPGVRRSINLTRLRNTVAIGDQKYNMLDLLAIEKNSGTLLYEERGEFDEFGGNASQASPIQPMPSGVMEDMRIYMDLVLNEVDNIRGVTGINEVADGSANTNDLLIGVMNGMNDISNSALGPEFEAISTMYVSTANIIGRRYQAALVNGEIELTSIRLTHTGLSTVKLLREYAFRGIDITCSPAPSQQDIDMMIQMVVARVQENKISQADMVIAIQFLRDRNVKMASLYLAKAVQQHEKNVSQQQIAVMKQQSEAQALLAQTQEEQKRMTLKEKGNQERETLILANDLDIKKMKEAIQAGVQAKAFEISAGSLAIK